MPAEESAGSPNYDWSQVDNEVVVKIPVDGSVGKEKLKVTFASTHLFVAVAGTTVLDKELSGRVVADESYWSLEGEGQARSVVVSLCKKKTGQWRTLTKDEEETLPEKSVLDEDFDVMALEHDDDDPERVEEQLENEKKLEARYAKLKSEKGLDNEDTLQTFFALFDNCIQLYRLNKLSDYLEDVVPVCRKRTDKYKLKAVQALAFVRWKQSKFREALPLLLEMEEILGKGAALCENIAHTYNSLGNYEQAEDYFRQALRFIEQEHGPNRGNRGGVLLGLGLVRDRLGKQKEALPVCQKAYEFYKERANGAPASLQAKAGISCAKINAKLGNLLKAEEYIREAVQMYEVTCGATSPLTASAYHELGKCLWKQRKREGARQALKRAYEIESAKDAWDLVTLLEIHNLLMDTHLKETDHIERSKFAEYFQIAEYIVHRVKRELPQDGNAAVYYKAAAEMKAWGGRYAEAKELFQLALPLLKAETSTDCTGLIQSVDDMLAFCDRNLAGNQASPMDFEVPQHVGDNGEVEGIGERVEQEQRATEGVLIEELDDDDASPGATLDMKCAGATASADSAPPTIEYREAAPGDYAAVAEICRSCLVEPLIPDEASFAAHLQGAGSGLCWVAVQGPDPVGFAVCGSDGVFGHLMQLVAVGDHADLQKSRLADKCADSCRSWGLRALHTTVQHDSDDGFFEALGWSASHRVYSHPSDFRPPKKSRVATQQDEQAAACDTAVAPSSSSASACQAEVSELPKQPKEPSKLSRDDKDTTEYYSAWDKLNVERTLVEEDGMDPSIVPAQERQMEDFGYTDLDVSSKLTTYSWDQSDKFVSLRFPFDGVGALPAENVESVFRQRGVLLVITDTGGKRRWFKVPNLCKDIDVEASTKNVKADQVVLKLRKTASSEKWSELTDDKDKYQEKRQYRINHGDLKGATTEELLADMYQNATDEERAGLRDAMKVNREKRREEAEAASGKRK